MVPGPARFVVTITRAPIFDMSPRVSIITRTKDRPLFLARCLASVEQQTYSNWVQVVVNDAGPVADVDALMAPLLARYPDKYLVLHRPQSTGMEAATNHGLTNSSGDLVTLLDDDDTWQPEFLATMVAAYQQRRAGSVRGVVCRSVRIFETVRGTRIEELRREIYNSGLWRVSLFEVAARNRFTVNAFLYERGVLDEIGLYREDLPVVGDWEFNLRFLLRFDVDFIATPLAAFHVRQGRTNGTAGNTVSNSTDLHQYYANLLQNEYLRADVAKGQMGLGHIMANASAWSSTIDNIEWETRALSPFNRLLSRIRGW